MLTIIYNNPAATVLFLISVAISAEIIINAWRNK